MSTVVYVKADTKTQVYEQDVFLSQVASVWCQDKNIENKCKAVKLMHIKDKKDTHYVFSMLEVVRRLCEMDKDIEVNSLGDADFIIDYKTKREEVKAWDWAKAAFVGIVTFAGAAFAIMAFNNDSDITTIFENLYMVIMGFKPEGFTLLELGYSVGLPIGILLFYNHFSKWKFNDDPTPIEVQMRTYEDDVNTTLIENASREDQNIDVS